jgi:hypothetical protein
MMVFIPLLTVVAMSGQAVPQGAPAEPIVQVGVYAYQSDGTISARAYGTPPLDSVVWTSESLCQTGAGGLPTGTAPAHAWKFSGTIVSQTADEAVIQLEWQRTYDHGQSISGRGGTVQLTLRRGEPVPLDFASPTAGTCGVASVGFEARYEPRFGLPAAGSGSGGGVGAGAGRGSGSGVGAAAGGSGSSSTTTMVDGSKRGAQARAARRPEMVDVNLWLVHIAPGRPEDVRHQSLRSTPDGAQFSFAPVTIDVPDGQVSVQVSGSYSITENGRQLAFSTNRAVFFRPTAAGPHRTTVTSSKGEGKTVIDMPGPDDVVEVGLPPFGIGVGPGGPGKVSIRVRIRPAQ